MPGFPSILLLAQESASPDELYDIIVLAPEKPVWPLVFYLVLALLLLAALGVWIRYLLRSRKTASGAENASVKAIRQLRELEQSHDTLEPNRFGLALSETLKDYLSATFADPVRFETTQEFLARLARGGTDLPPAAQQELKEFLVAAEEVKFGNTPDAAERTMPLFHRAKALLSLCQSINSGEREKDKAG